MSNGFTRIGGSPFQQLPSARLRFNVLGKSQQRASWNPSNGFLPDSLPSKYRPSTQTNLARNFRVETPKPALTSLIPVRREELAPLAFAPARDDPRFPPKAVRLKKGPSEEIVAILERRPVREAHDLLKTQDYPDKVSRHIHPQQVSDVILGRTLDGMIIGYLAGGYGPWDAKLGYDLFRMHKITREDPNAEIKGMGWAMAAYAYYGLASQFFDKPPDAPVFHNIEKWILEDFRSRSYAGRRSPVEATIHVEDPSEEFPPKYGFMPKKEAAFLRSLFHFTDLPEGPSRI